MSFWSEFFRLLAKFAGFVILILISWEMIKIHDHLHSLECATLGYMTDDGVRWEGHPCPEEGR